MIPLKDGKVCWPKGYGSKKERLEIIEREYGKRLEDIKALQEIIAAISTAAVRMDVPAVLKELCVSADAAAQGLNKAIYVDFSVNPEAPNG